MKITKLNSIILFFIGLAVTLLSFNLPSGWTKGGSSYEKFDSGIDKGMGQNGKNAATIKSKNVDPNSSSDFGSLTQNFNPGKYLGKKIKLSGYIKTRDVAGWAALWMRIDQPKKYSLENMKNRFVRGNSDWTKCEVIMDVPQDTKNIAFGGLLSGSGQMWFDNLKIEVAGSSDKVLDQLETGEYEYKTLAQNAEAINLDFSK